MSDKAAIAALDRAIRAIRTKLKRPDFAVRLSKGGVRSVVSEVIPLGISVLDHYVIGVGGLPIGRTSEWSGPEGAGKTAITLAAGAAVQRMGGIFIYGDAEGSFNEERCATFGCDPALTGLVQCDALEEYGPAMVIAMSALDGKVPALVAYDSIGGSTTNAEMAGDHSGDAMGKKASMIAKMVRGMNALARAKRAHVMLINQIRKQVGVAFGDPIYTPGGDAPKHVASLRVRMYPGSKVEQAGVRVGQMPSFACIKNRHAVPHHKAVVRFLYTTGFDEVWSLIEHAKDEQLIPEDAKVSPKTYEEARDALKWPVNPQAGGGARSSAAVGPDGAGGGHPDDPGGGNDDVG